MVERLTAETRAHHAEADSDIDALFRKDVTATRYLLFLMRLCGFEAPLDAAIAMTPKLELVLDLRARSRAGYLAQDLMALGVRPAEVTALPLCLGIPQFRSVAEAMGWLFVVERTTLAHNLIRRHLMTVLPLEMEAASAYLSSYDGVVGKRWQELGAALDHVARHPAVAERIIAAAHDAFRCRRNWSRQDTANYARSTG
jgi:heme oxygenase (biliverdin-IX-beta and delta-forming)